ncbi:MAG: OmpH family outer membrane protein [Planctomycetota bacterium]
MRFFISSMVVAAMSLAAASQANAQSSQIAVIDVAKIFKETPAIVAEVDAIKAEVAAQKTELQKRQQTLVAESQKLKDHKPGTEGYSKVEETIANMESRMRLDMARTRKGLADKEAKVFFDNYQTIKYIVSGIAKENNIKVVLRYNSEDMEGEKPDTIVRGVMKNVVYHAPEIDITQMVQRYLTQQAAKPQTRR